MIKIIYLLIFLLIISILSSVIEITLIYELFSYVSPHVKLGFNVGSILADKQLRELLELLDNESAEYGTCERRINIYAYMWQFLPVFLVRVGLAHTLKNQELIMLNKDIIKKNKGLAIGWYCENNNFIEIYEFNLRIWCKKNNISEKIYIAKVLFHEYRHKYQFNTGMTLSDEELEMDAENFAESFYNKSKNRIHEIMGI